MLLLLPEKKNAKNMNTQTKIYKFEILLIIFQIRFLMNQ